MAKMPWMFLGQFLVASAFTVIFAACVAEKRRLSCTLRNAAAIGVLVGGGQIIMYAVQPFPGTLVVKWCSGISCRCCYLASSFTRFTSSRLRVQPLARRRILRPSDSPTLVREWLGSQAEIVRCLHVVLGHKLVHARC